MPPQEHWGQFFLCEWNVIYRQLCKGKSWSWWRELSLLLAANDRLWRRNGRRAFHRDPYSTCIDPTAYFHTVMDGIVPPSPLLVQIITNQYALKAPASEYHFNTWFIPTNAARVQESMVGCTVTKSLTALWDQSKQSAKCSQTELVNERKGAPCLAPVPPAQVSLQPGSVLLKLPFFCSVEICLTHTKPSKLDTPILAVQTLKQME